jgi:hypothetical protein
MFSLLKIMHYFLMFRHYEYYRLRYKKRKICLLLINTHYRYTTNHVQITHIQRRMVCSVTTTDHLSQLFPLYVPFVVYSDPCYLPWISCLRVSLVRITLSLRIFGLQCNTSQTLHLTKLYCPWRVT